MAKLYEGKDSCFQRAVGDMLQQKWIEVSICTNSMDGYFPSDFVDIFQEVNGVVAFDIYVKDIEEMVVKEEDGAISFLVIIFKNMNFYKNHFLQTKMF